MLRPPPAPCPASSGSKAEPRGMVWVQEKGWRLTEGAAGEHQLRETQRWPSDGWKQQTKGLPDASSPFFFNKCLKSAFLSSCLCSVLQCRWRQSWPWDLGTEAAPSPAPSGHPKPQPGTSAHVQPDPGAPGVLQEWEGAAHRGLCQHAARGYKYSPCLPARFHRRQVSGQETGCLFLQDYVFLHWSVGALPQVGFSKVSDNAASSPGEEPARDERGASGD